MDSERAMQEGDYGSDRTSYSGARVVKPKTSVTLQPSVTPPHALKCRVDLFAPVNSGPVSSKLHNNARVIVQSEPVKYGVRNTHSHTDTHSHSYSHSYSRTHKDTKQCAHRRGCTHTQPHIAYYDDTCRRTHQCSVDSASPGLATDPSMSSWAMVTIPSRVNWRRGPPMHTQRQHLSRVWQTG